MSEITKEPEVFKGFEDIALCFSGGGYRAACFSLGTLSFLNKIGLLEKVKTISTVSGGTITGVRYVQSHLEGESFNTFFTGFYNWLNEDKLLENAIGHIKGNKIWNQKENLHKKRNPINAFSIEYNSLTKNRNLGEIDKMIRSEKSHLKRVVFNTTDFSFSRRFRFQNISQGSKLGNPSVQELVEDLNGHINMFKLGDIIASSSAFPGGFEPIAFPSDFDAEKKIEMAEIGLMDGGIIDNQGISSIMTSNKKYDLYFISDVSSPYSYDEFKFAKDSFPIKILNFFTHPLWLVILICFSVGAFFKDWQILYAFGLICSSISFTFQILFWLLDDKIKGMTGIIEEFKIPSNRFGYYLFDRINSLLKMNTEVFLKSTRRGNYKSIYSKFAGDIITSTIYVLRCRNVESKPENQNDWNKIKYVIGDISEKVKKVSTYASSFGTTLWFNKSEKTNGMLDSVVACTISNLS